MTVRDSKKLPTNKLSGNLLTNHQERLLIAYHDGECGPLRRFLARRLLNQSVAAQEFVHTLRNVGGVIKNSRSEGMGDVDLWSRISARIEAEERSSVLLGKRQFGHWSSVAPTASKWGEWRHRFTWGASGAVVAALFAALVVQGGALNSGSQLASAPALLKLSSRAPVVAPVAFNGAQGYSGGTFSSAQSAVSPLEMDWVRSEGRVHVMQDPGESSAIIWVKPRAQMPQASFVADSSQRLSRRYSRSNSHIPVAIPAMRR